MWPYKQSKPRVKVKPRGFWQDPLTIQVLQNLKNNQITNEEATRQLKCLPDDPKWYIKHYDRNGWPNQ